MVTYPIELDIKSNKVLETDIAMTQGDYGNIKLDIRVKDNDNYIADATGGELTILRSDGYITKVDVVHSAGTFSYVLKGNELESAGKAIATLTLKWSNGRVSACKFSFGVRYNPTYDKLIPAGSYIPELEKIKAQAQSQVDYLQYLIDQLKPGIGSTALTRQNLTDHFLQTVSGVNALDAVAGKRLKDQLDKLNSDLAIMGKTISIPARTQTIAPGSATWLTDWYLLPAGVYICCVRSMETTGVTLYVHDNIISDTDYTTKYKGILPDAGIGTYIFSIKSLQYISAYIKNNATGGYNTYAGNPGAYGIELMQIK